MVERMATKLVSEFVAENIIERKRKEEYIYAMTCEMESVITIGSILLISLCIKKMIPTICFLFSFFSLRKRTGGYHLNSFIGCYGGTICLYWLMVRFCNVLIEWHVYTLTALSILCIAIIGTVNHPNVQMTFDEMQRAKKSSRLILVVEIAITLFMIWLKVDPIIVKFFLMGIIVCAALLLVAKIVGQEVKS